MKVNETIRMIKEGRMDSLLIQLYGEEKLTDSRERCRMVLDGYGKTFGTEEDVLLFSSPGRTEISGNHTDHNHGKVLAGSINLTSWVWPLKTLPARCVLSARRTDRILPLI